MKKLLSILGRFFKLKKNMSYTSNDVSNITILLNQGTNNFSFIEVHNPPISDYELTYDYQHQIIFKIIYRSSGDINFSLSNSSLFLEELTKELFSLSLLLVKNKQDILNQFIQLRIRKGLLK